MTPTLPPGTALDAEARERVDALAALFRGAVRQLAEIEARLREGTVRKAYLQARLREARRVIDRLMRIRGGRAGGPVLEWAREHFPKTYQMGAGMAVRDLKAQGLLPVAGEQRVHARAIEAVLDRYVANTTEIVVQLNANVVRASRVVLAEAGFGEEIAAGITGGLPRRETSALLKRELRDAVRGVAGELEAGALTDVEIGGRRMQVDHWAEMHARTETARCSTAGTRVLSATNGVLHVQITSHAHAPCICTPFEGRIYRIYEDAGDERFPWIGEVPAGGCPMHPNCVHREAPAVVEYLEARGEVEGRESIPEDFRGLSDTELARVVRAHREELRRYSEARDGILPQGFRLAGRRAA